MTLMNFNNFFYFKNKKRNKHINIKITLWNKLNQLFQSQNGIPYKYGNGKMIHRNVPYVNVI